MGRAGLPAFRNWHKTRIFLRKVYRDWVDGPPLFPSVELETSSTCNRKCVYCPNSSVGRPEEDMDEDLYKKIIDELAAIGYAGRLSPHFYGEPLLDTRLVQWISYARSKLPRAFIKLFTNGDFLSLDLFHSLVTAGVDRFRIAQHSPKPTQTLAHTLDRLGPEVRSRRIEYLSYYDQSQPLFNRGGSVEVRQEWKLDRCGFASGVTIDVQGNVLLCCNDYLSQNSFGNLREEPLLKIWNRRSYRMARYKIESGLWPFEICRICVGESTSVPRRAPPVRHPLLPPKRDREPLAA